MGTALKLLDAVAQSTDPFVVRQHNGDEWRLTSCCDFSEQIRRCPLRYVLTDDLVRLCTVLGFFVA